MRGLPHAHCFFFMTSQSKTTLAHTLFVDSIISEKILPASSSTLCQVIPKHNMHRLCESFNPSAVYMDDGICTKWFPKQFVEKTGHHNAQLSVAYRRRAPDSGVRIASWTCHTPGGTPTTETADNSWVVPYSSKLSVMFLCHLNVELCVSGWRNYILVQIRFQRQW